MKTVIVVTTPPESSIFLKSLIILLINVRDKLSIQIDITQTQRNSSTSQHFYSAKA